MDINTTKYLVKPNVETTKYFTDDGGQQVIDDLENQINQKENITDHNEDVSNLSNRIRNNSSNIEINASAIDNHEIRIRALESNPVNPYEGLLSYSYVNIDATIINYNNNLGNMIIWNSGNDNIYMTVINNVDTTNNVELSNDISSIILPGIVKKINQDNSLNKIINKIHYLLDDPSVSNRKSLNSLKSITILPNVYSIEFNLIAALNLKYFNIFNGLQKISLSNVISSDPIPNLIIPSSVIECELNTCFFDTLTFEFSNNNLKLIYKDSKANTKFCLLRSLTNDSSFTFSDDIYRYSTTYFRMLCTFFKCFT